MVFLMQFIYYYYYYYLLYVQYEVWYVGSYDNTNKLWMKYCKLSIAEYFDRIIIWCYVWLVSVT